MGFLASNFSTSTSWLVVIIIDLIFLEVYLGYSFLLLPNGLERVKISKTVVKNLVYGCPLTLRCLTRLQSGTKEYSIFSIFSTIASTVRYDSPGQKL